MSRYEGKALERPRRGKGGRKPRPGFPLRLPLLVLAAMLCLGVLAMLPWGEFRSRVLVVGRVRVSGLRYLDAAQVERRSGLAAGTPVVDRNAFILKSELEKASVEE